MPLVKERLKYFSELPEISRFFFREPEEYEAAELIPKKLDVKSALEIFRTARPLIEALFNETDEQAEEAFREKAAGTGTKLGDLLMPLRVAVTGSKVSPPLFGSLRVLGQEESLKRIDRAISLFESQL